MPPQRKRPAPSPSMPADGGAPSPEELEQRDELEQHHSEDPMLGQHQDQPGEEEMSQAPQTLIYEGEILTSGVTLAVLLPGDHKESYFPVKFTGRRQPHESAEDLANRVITVVRETVLGQMDDAIDALDEYGKQLAASGRLKQ